MAWMKLTKKHTEYGSLILVTPRFPLVRLPEVKDMAVVFEESPEIRMEQYAVVLLRALVNRINCGNKITAVSGFRTKEEQEDIWKDSLKANGLEFTKKFVAIPGCSEHQTGMAIDLAENKENIDFICPDFPRTGIFQKFRQEAPKYGFIERYPAGKEAITGIGEEPWHFRYVGYPHSRIMTERNMVLEEYILFLKEHTDLEHPYVFKNGKTDIEISYIPLDGEEPEIILVQDSFPYMVSGTNEGGIVLCVWKEKAVCIEKGAHGLS